MPPNYITPITKIYSTFAEAKEFYDKYGGITFFEDDERPRVVDFIQGKRNLIVGEPGVGKSLLLQKIRDHLMENGHRTELIYLRQPSCTDMIDTFMDSKVIAPKALLLDGLDEVQSSHFPSVIQKIEEISSKYPDLPIYLSSRWVFISRYATSFPEYRYIIACPFTQGQVKEYLLAAKHKERDIDELLHRIMSFNHRMLVIQIPRYLSYLEGYLQKNSLDAAAKASRNDLFEHFIYGKLDHEDRKLKSDKKAIIKRVLEKLALTMEIYQTNVLSKDELMTFFDELVSDLKLVALSQIDLEVFYDCSLLKNNIDSIEFDNTEFQEYLAAKEITRMPDSNRATFGFAVDPNAKEIYPTWFNTLTFLVDMQADLLPQLVDFSGIRASDFKVMDDAFLLFLSRVDPRSLAPELRRELFTSIVAYHTRAGQWLPGKLTSALPGFFDQPLEETLKTWVLEAETQKDSARYVPLGNICYVVAYLLQDGIPLDYLYWREKLITYASEQDESGVLQRHALFGLEQLGDPTVIDILPEPLTPDELVSQGFLSLCAELDPDNPRSLEYFFTAVRKDDFHGRYGILAAKKPESIKKFLQTFNTDTTFRREFLDDTRVFGDRDNVLVENIGAVLNDEIRELCMESLVQSVHHSVAHNAEQSTFIIGISRLLRLNDLKFVSKIIERIKNSPDGKSGLYFSHSFFGEILEEEDVPVYIDSMIAADERWAASSLMQRLKFSKRKGAEKIYEAGRSKLVEEYKNWEARLVKPDTSAKDRDDETLSEFRMLLEPAPKQFSHGVFEFYNDNKAQLDRLISVDEKNRLAELITGTIFKFVQPTKHDLTITAEQNGSKTYTTNTGIYAFGEALITAKHLGIDITPFRPNIIGFIPFAHTDELRVLFDLIKDIKSVEMGPVIEIYRDRKSDLWRHQPLNFAEAVEKYHVIGAVPILRGFVKETTHDDYARRKALTVAESVAPDPGFLKEIIVLYRDTTNQTDKKLADIANGLLVTSHHDREAIQWRLSEVVRRAAGFTRIRGVHRVGDLEEEIGHGKTFAKPLMELKYPGYEESYLDLLDKAMGVWSKGKEFHEYATYLWEIVYSYFDNLKETRSYVPLQMIERRIAEMKDRDGANWVASRMLHLRRSYLEYLGKPRNVSEAVRRYNSARSHDDKKIISSADLFQHIQDALETDLQRWIEGEGAYDLIIGEKVYATKRQEYEKLVQRTLKAQVENIMLRRGFQVDVMREPELLDGKKTDFFIRYGFVGPVIIEVKLTSNSDLKGANIDKSASYESMNRYMKGFTATHGIVLVINNTNAKNLPEIKKVFQGIQNVWVVSFDCGGYAGDDSDAGTDELKSVREQFLITLVKRSKKIKL